MQRSLLIGCGSSRAKKLFTESHPDWAGELTTLDFNPNCGADVVFDLERISCPQMDRLHGFPILPFEDKTFDEIAAYDVLEHFGRQGDWRGWFSEMAEFHRILKPGGLFGVIVPTGADALADPGHTRFFSANYFNMLNQAFYVKALEQGAAVTDYRWYWTLDFEVLFLEHQGDHHLGAILRKPL